MEPFRASPWATILLAIAKIVEGMIPGVLTVGTGLFLDKVNSMVQKKELDIILPSLLIIAAAISAGWLIGIIISFAKQRLILNLQTTFEPRLLKFKSELRYYYMEQDETQQLFARVENKPNERLVDGYLNILNILAFIVRIINLFLLIELYIPYSFWVMSAIMVFIIVISLKYGRDSYEAFDEATISRRRADYYQSVLVSREAGAERTLFRYTDFLNKSWKKEFETSRLKEYTAQKKNFIKVMSVSSVTVLLVAVVAFILVSPLEKGDVTAGMYISLVASSFLIVSQMSWTLSDMMQIFEKSRRYQKDVKEYFCLEKDEKFISLSDEKDLKCGKIEFIDVSFTYPGSSQKILDHLSLTLQNKNYAIVGENGCGKTTIIKLLIGLYDQYEGTILLNGEDIKTISNKKLHNMFGVIFQDFAKYQLTVQQHLQIGMGVNAKNEDTAEKENHLLQAVGLLEEVENFSLKKEQHLGKIYEDGVELSGGQWQRLALARLMAGERPIQILDEPTAALDPIMENQIYRLFRKAMTTQIKGKLSIWITHRLGAAILADEVLVIKDGKLHEQGSHRELLARQGYYSRMYEQQKEWYQ